MPHRTRRRGRPQDLVPAVAEGISGKVMAHVVGIDVSPAVLHEWSRTLSLFIGAMYRRDYARAAHRVMVEMSGALAGARALDGFPPTPRRTGRGPPPPGPCACSAAWRPPPRCSAPWS
ncbi:hypothetical protein O1L60_29370 [Streptomyces diastatochromogenes]|nr:hypothetical protein [Streptomyces diastatochromogenes]